MQDNTFFIKQITDSNHPSIEVMVQWMDAWWGNKEGFSLEKMHAYICRSLQHNRIPKTFVLYAGETPAGMYQFSMADLDVRPDKYPWLINVYIAPAFRKQGLFPILMRSVREEAEKLQLDGLYLYTYHTGLYEKYGFIYQETFETFITPGDMQRLYYLPLKETHPK